MAGGRRQAAGNRQQVAGGLLPVGLVSEFGALMAAVGAQVTVSDLMHGQTHLQLLKPPSVSVETDT